MPEIQSFLYLNKEIGETPLECIKRFQSGNPEYLGVPMTYAGRLDPMAEGVLLVLTGVECKNKEKYLGLDKEYEVEILFGFSTDTFDVLGKVVEGDEVKDFDEKKAKDALQTFVGKFVQEYPMYSSKTVEGKPLFARALSGEFPDEMPTREVEIYSIEYLSMRQIASSELLSDIENRIAKVKGDFRQREIISCWREYLQNINTNYPIIKIKVHCSSGTYMRSLADNLGKKLGVPALAYLIKRTKIISSLL